MTATNSITVAPCSRIAGELRVPGDKSVSHRAAMLAAVAHGISTVEGFLESEDCLCTLHAVEQLGVQVERDGASIRIDGTGGLLREPCGPLDLGNSGTGMRLLAGLLAGQPFTTELTGDASLCSRPMQRIRDPLQQMGATVDLLGEGGCAPMRIRGGRLHAINYPLPVDSAQIKSCTLLAGLYAEGTTVVMGSKPTRDHTERMLCLMGAGVAGGGCEVSIESVGGTNLPLKGTHVRVPGDFSSAAFWLALAACREGSEVTVKSMGLNPSRTALLDVLVRMGAQVEIDAADALGSGYNPKTVGEPIGDVTIRGGGLRGTVVEGGEIPNLIDELPLVAVLGACARGTTVIHDAGELRVKESDRIATTAALLRAVGVRVDEQSDGMIVHGGTISGNVTVESGGDHRIAMAGAILGLLADDSVTVRDIACIATSYPSFWDDLECVRA